MFWKRRVEEAKVEKLPGPKAILELVREYLVTELKQNEFWVRQLRCVVRKNPKGEKAFDVRVFSEERAVAKRVTVKDYTFLDEHPELILYEGWFDEASKRVELEDKASLKVSQDGTIFTKEEIQKKIEGLSEPGSTVFFYLAGSQALGGPLGRGAAVVELNPNYPGKKQKKYILYTASVDGMQPLGKGQKFLDSDKPEQIALWIKDRHHPPLL